MADSLTEQPVATPTAPSEPVTSSTSTTATGKAVPINFETTTAKDAALPVNQTTQAPVAPATPTEAPDTAAPAEEAKPVDLPPLPDTSKPAEPVLVTEKEVASRTSEASLADQIENLSGEIQSLQSKLDRLTSHFTVAPTSDSLPSADTKDSSKPALPNVSWPEHAATAASTTSGMAPAPGIEPITKNEPAAPAPATTNAGGPAGDLYNKIAKESEDKEDAVTHEEKDEVVEEHHSTLGTIGIALTVVGILLFVTLLLLPLFKEFLGEEVWAMIKSIGWLTALATLGLGTVLAVFGHAKFTVKVFAILFLVLLTVMFLGVNGYTGVFGPLAAPLESLFSFYK